MNDLIDAHLSDLALFVRVANAGGFTAASRQTKIPQASVSRRIALLEDKLGARLFNRTTRSVALTEAGRRVYEHARLMVEQGEAAGAAIEMMHATPSGTLNITSTVVLGHYFLSDLTARFMAKYPDVTVKMELTGRRVDIVEEGFDIALRVGSLPDSGLALTQLRTLGRGFYATKDYLRTAPPLHQPSDLAHHSILAFARTLDPLSLVMSKGETAETVLVQPILSANDTKPILNAALCGLGIAQLPRFLGNDEVSAGRCIEVLTDWRMPETELNALTPSFKGEVPAVKEFLAMLRTEFR